MPIRVDNDLPAREVLESENIFMMGEERADTQQIRPLEIVILNLMPLKQDYEIQLLRATVKYAAAGQCYLYECEQSCVKTHICQPYQ